MHIDSLLKEDNIEKRNHDLKRAFNFATLPIDITGYEHTALVILINLTVKVSPHRDVVSETLAKKLINDENHMESCISSLEFLQTYNMKYPNYRCKGVIRTFEGDISQKKHLTSATKSENVQFDWSNNAAEINHCLLFGAAFQLKGKVTSLANEIAYGNPDVKILLIRLGIKESIQNEIGKSFIKIQKDKFPSIALILILSKLGLKLLMESLLPSRL